MCQISDPARHAHAQPARNSVRCAGRQVGRYSLVQFSRSRRWRARPWSGCCRCSAVRRGTGVGGDCGRTLQRGARGRPSVYGAMRGLGPCGAMPWHYIIARYGQYTAVRQLPPAHLRWVVQHGHAQIDYLNPQRPPCRLALLHRRSEHDVLGLRRTACSAGGRGRA
jgi:hypothetical protein